ncbi:MAG: hypothetical protein Q9166_005710 [cf. Caloplaca sp. 2 TL-2023]
MKPLRLDFKDRFARVVALIKVRQKFQADSPGYKTVDDLIKRLMSGFTLDKPQPKAEDEDEDDAAKRGRKRDADLMTKLRKVSRRCTDFRSQNLSVAEVEKLIVIIAALKGISDEPCRQARDHRRSYTLNREWKDTGISAYVCRHIVVETQPLAFRVLANVMHAIIESGFKPTAETPKVTVIGCCKCHT